MGAVGADPTEQRHGAGDWPASPLRGGKAKVGAETQSYEILSPEPARRFYTGTPPFKTAGAHAHSPLPDFAFLRTRGAIPPKALMQPAQEASPAGPSDFSPTGPKALRGQRN